MRTAAIIAALVAALTSVLWKAMLGVGLVVGTIGMWIVILNLTDINAERGAYVDGHWVPTGTRWCEQYPSKSPVPWMWLSYWFTCEGGAWIPRPRRHDDHQVDDHQVFEPLLYAHWLCPYVTTCSAVHSASTWDDDFGFEYGKMTAVRHDDDDPYFEEEP